MKGQAQTTLPPIFVAALGFGVVFLSIIYSILTIASNEAYQRQLYVTGMGLDLQALQALGKDINAEREITDAGAYNLVFEGGQVYTRQRGVATSTFLFTQIPELAFTGGEFSPTGKNKTIGPLKMFKIANRYGIAKPDKVPSPYLLLCDSPKGKPLKTISLQPDANTQKLADTLRAGKPKINIGQGEALITLTSTNQEAAKAYYNTPESRRLACEILNRITEEYRIPVRPIPTNSELYPKQDPKTTLKGKPAVTLEIPDRIAQEKQLAQQIYKGIENYGME